MITITITKKTNRLFDRMPLPKAHKTKNFVTSRKAIRTITETFTLNKYQSHPFVRKVTRIA